VGVASPLAVALLAALGAAPPADDAPAPAPPVPQGPALDAALLLDGRTRDLSPPPGPPVPGTTTEVIVHPRVSLAVTSSDLDLHGTYEPRFRSQDVATQSRVLVLHTGEAGGRARIAPAWTLSLTATGARGTTDLISEATRTPDQAQTITTTRLLEYVAGRADLRLEGALDPRTTWTLVAGGYIEGGADPASRALLPLGRGFRAETFLDRDATRLDRLSLRLSATGARFSDDTTSGIAGLMATWRRTLGPTLESWLGAGALITAEQLAGASLHYRAYPAAEAGLSHPDARLHLTERIAAVLGAIVDRASGDVIQQLDLGATASWTPRPQWALTGRAAGALGRQPAGLSRRGGFDLRVDYSPTETVSFGLGGYGQWQRTPEPTLPSFQELGIYLAARFATPTYRP